MHLGRASLPAESIALLRLLSAYAVLLERIEAFSEADSVRAETLRIVHDGQLDTVEAAEAFLRYGQLLGKTKNYQRAIAHLQEAVRRVGLLEGLSELPRQVMLAGAWRDLALAFEAIGEFSRASDALDVLTTAQRAIRFLVFSPSRRSE